MPLVTKCAEYIVQYFLATYLFFKKIKKDNVSQKFICKNVNCVKSYFSLMVKQFSQYCSQNAAVGGLNLPMKTDMGLNSLTSPCLSQVLGIKVRTSMPVQKNFLNIIHFYQCFQLLSKAKCKESLLLEIQLYRNYWSS